MAHHDLSKQHKIFLTENKKIHMITVAPYTNYTKKQKNDAIYWQYTCKVSVPELLSSSPWIRRRGFFILLANINGLMLIYVCGASHRVLSSFCSIITVRFKTRELIKRREWKTSCYEETSQPWSLCQDKNCSKEEFLDGGHKEIRLRSRGVLIQGNYIIILILHPKNPG